ncbi:50S ribosomal protein L29 [Luoshenia tenuis]|jgi:large subunit ribosomal protein L29|uniref:50S ribosomal protein L29 n=1 Tax=Luoshenia tenuis TaxID=2763654 RepID=UPI003D936858
MKAAELREKSSAELNKQLVELKANLFNLRFQQATGQLSNPMVIRDCKRDIARIMTVIRERELTLAQ